MPVSEVSFGLDVQRSPFAEGDPCRTACDLASHWRLNGRADDALRLLQPIYGQFTEGFGSVDLMNAVSIIDRLQSEQAPAPSGSRRQR